jgi:hypothetical protein
MSAKKKANTSKPKRAKPITTKAVQSTEGLPPRTLPNVTVKPEVDEGPWGDDGLTQKQRLFVMHLLGAAGGNASKAAKLAGYSDSHEKALGALSSRTRAMPHVQAAIDRELARRQLTPDDIVGGLFARARANLGNFYRRDDDGKLVFDLEHAADLGAMGQLKEIREEVIKGGDGPAVVISRTVKIHDPVPALTTLAKIQGMLKDKVEHSGTVKFNPITLDGDKTAATDDAE